ncbi:Zinc finger protein 532 [Camelus dromedarius]|uniref:Zinc finger protein 532 n=2 Tax=Camelus TaxID=9836 RepID=A0A5N4DKR1_CAMDR|nr:zinc finger protein 532-like [Camelus ferus]EPY72527.1 hypothetical protein CB1_001729001 [Camelus ferus]KAB1271639.1 Zinc finger protein 532 [Camelus dromedarius]
MHGIKDPDLKEMTEATNEEEMEIKEDAKIPSPKRKLEEPVLEFRPPRVAITQPLKELINIFKVRKCACGASPWKTCCGSTSTSCSTSRMDPCTSPWSVCYTSHVSLCRHFVIHKHKEPQPVVKQNGVEEAGEQAQP